MSSKDLGNFVKSYGTSSPEASLWVAVIKQAKKDLTHHRIEVREEAESFLFCPSDDGLKNIMNMLGLDGDFGKEISREFVNREM